MKNKILGLVLVLSMLFSLAVVPVQAALSGFCGYGYKGYDLSWTLDDSGTLTISGTGNMMDYSYGSTPWYSSHESIKAAVIEDGVNSIGVCAFDGCNNLTSITIPDSVASIGYYAFRNCSRLTSITIPAGVTRIADYAFYGCSGLTSITIPASVTSIGILAFGECGSLASITIPDNVTRIGCNAFYNTAWYNNQPDGLVYAGKVAYTYKGAVPENTSVVLKDDTKGIADYAFFECQSLTSITIPNSVTSISDHAFCLCGLTSITIPDSVISIEDCAFNGCCLTSITIPDSVTSIGKSAFYGCSSLTSIAIPASVTSIGKNAFCMCYNLPEINVSEQSQNYSTQDGVLFDKDKTTLICRPGDKPGSYTIPAGVTIIGDSAFSECRNLTSITIPDGVTSIGDYAFQGCDSLTDVYYKGRVEKSRKIDIGSGNEKLRDAKWTFGDEIGIFINGQPTECDQAPIITNGRTLVPMRAIFEALGAEVGWDDVSKTATGTKNSKIVSITINDNAISIDGNRIEIDVPAQIVNNRTMVPVRAVSEAFGCAVTWDSDERCVNISF